jgi:hypothetical protein
MRAAREFLLDSSVTLSWCFEDERHPCNRRPA